MPDGPDFYGPVSGLFRADPRRTDEPLLDALLAWPDPTTSGSTSAPGRAGMPCRWRSASGRSSPWSRRRGCSALAELADEHGIANVRVVDGALATDSPATGPLRADVALIAHLGYDIEAIGPFLDAMEAAAARRCVAVLMDRQPSSIADPFWPPIHGEARVALPALPEFVDLLRARPDAEGAFEASLFADPRGSTRSTSCMVSSAASFGSPRAAPMGDRRLRTSVEASWP